MPAPHTPSSLTSLLDPQPLRVLGENSGPYSGNVIMHDGRPAVLIDADSEIAGSLWDAPTPHVVAPLDVARTASGLGLVLPMCVVSLDELLAVRRASGTPLDAGEAITLTVSILRGTVAETRAHSIAGCHGAWWLTEDGTPTYVHGQGDEPAAAAGTALSAIAIALSPSDLALRQVIERAADLTHDTRLLLSQADAAEDLLFSYGAATAVRVEHRGARATSFDALLRPEDGQAAPQTSVIRRVSALLSGLLQRQTKRATTSAPKSTSRAPLVLVVVAVVIGIVAVGLLLPMGGEQPDPASPPLADARATNEPNVPPASEPSAIADLQVVVAALLDEHAACAGDADCLAAVTLDARPVSVEGAAFAPDRAVRLLDDLGGAAVFKAEDPTGALPAQLITIVLRNDEWVLRDVRDVEQHPLG